MDKPASKHKQMYMNIYYMYMHNIFWVTGPTVEPLYTEAVGVLIIGEVLISWIILRGVTMRHVQKMHCKILEPSNSA